MTGLCTLTAFPRLDDHVIMKYNHHRHVEIVSLSLRNFKRSILSQFYVPKDVLYLHGIRKVYQTKCNTYPVNFLLLFHRKREKKSPKSCLCETRESAQANWVTHAHSVNRPGRACAEQPNRLFKGFYAPKTGKPSIKSTGDVIRALSCKEEAQLLSLFFCFRFFDLFWKESCQIL